MHLLITVTYGWSAFPSSQRRGGAKRRGGQFGETLRRSDHPGCAASVASRHSFEAQPPLLCEEGNALHPYVTVITKSST